LPPSLTDCSANLTPASGRQDHTTSPSASAPLVSRRYRVHRIPCPTSVTIAKRPSGGPERRGNSHRCERMGNEIFFLAGLDHPNQIESFQQIRVYAQRFSIFQSGRAKRPPGQIIQDLPDRQITGVRRCSLNPRRLQSQRAMASCGLSIEAVRFGVTCGPRAAVEQGLFNPPTTDMRRLWRQTVASSAGFPVGDCVSPDRIACPHFVQSSEISHAVWPGTPYRRATLAAEPSRRFGKRRPRYRRIGPPYTDRATPRALRTATVPDRLTALDRAI